MKLGLLGACMLFFQFSYAQDIDSKFLLLGSLSDYMGRRCEKFTDTSEVERFNKIEKLLADTISKLLSVRYSDLTLDTTEFGIRNLGSVNLNEDVNQFYDFFPSGAYTMRGDTVFYGKLRANIFENEDQVYSFLLGAYLRFGFNNGNSYFYFLGNSLSKASIIVGLLNQLKCADVVYTVDKESIPNGHAISFIPTGKLKDILDSYAGIGYFSGNEDLGKELAIHIEKNRKRKKLRSIFERKL